MPAYTMILAFVWSSVNAYLQARYFTKLGPIYPVSHLYSFTFLLGVFIFFVGMTINIHSDRILTNLRYGNFISRLTTRKPGETGYRIPHGGFFRYISGWHLHSLAYCLAPNLIGEVIEFIGYIIATGGALPAIAFWAFSSASLVPKAIHHHQWYLEKFDNYPKDRRAVIPFVY